MGPSTIANRNAQDLDQLRAKIAKLKAAIERRQEDYAEVQSKLEQNEQALEEMLSVLPSGAKEPVNILRLFATEVVLRERLGQSQNELKELAISLKTIGNSRSKACKLWTESIESEKTKSTMEGVVSKFLKGNDSTFARTILDDWKDMVEEVRRSSKLSDDEMIDFIKAEYDN